MHWKETGLTGPAEVLGRYPITITAPEEIRHIGAVHPIEPIKALLQEPLPIEAQLQQDHRAAPIEVALEAPQQDHQVAPIEVPAVPTVPVAALEALAVLLQDPRLPVVAEVVEGATKKHGPIF